MVSLFPRQVLGKFTINFTIFRMDRVVFGGYNGGRDVKAWFQNPGTLVTLLG